VQRTYPPIFERWLLHGVRTANISSPPRLIARLNFVCRFINLVRGSTKSIYFQGDAETQKMVTTWTLGSQVNHQQVGNVWNGESNIVSLSLSGDLNIFDPRIGDKPSRILSVRSFSTVMVNNGFTLLPRRHKYRSILSPKARTHSWQEQSTVVSTLTQTMQRKNQDLSKARLTQTVSVD